MPTIRLERLAIRSLFLGLLGLDHLQLVYDPYGFGQHLQDHWYVMEGVRDPSPHGPQLSVQGADGTLTLARANTARDEALAARIGTPLSRRHTVVAEGAAAETLWPRLASHATAIAAEAWPYIAYAAPSSSLPTVNSTSMIASVLHHAGLDAAASLPPGLAFMPGLETLLGTPSDDSLIATARHATLLGGGGDDRLVGAQSSGAANKLYGGAGNDTCIWSPAVAVCHGGQPRMPGAADGTDTLGFDAAAHAVVGIAPPVAAADLGTGLTLAVGAARTRTYSIEVLRWSDRSDRIALAPAAFASPGPLALQMSGEDAHGPGDILDLARIADGASVLPQAGSYVVTSASPHAQRAITVDSVETLWATPGADHLRLGGGLRRVAAGPGDDVVVVTPVAGSLRLDVGSGADTLVLEFADAARAPLSIDVSGGGRDDRVVFASPEAGCPEESAIAAPEMIHDPHNARLTLTLRSRAGTAMMTVRFHAFADGHWGLHPGRAPAAQHHLLASGDCPRQRDRLALGSAAEMMSNHLQLTLRSSGPADGTHCESAVHDIADGDAACRTPRATGRLAAPARSRRALHLAERRPPRGRQRHRRGNHRPRRRNTGAPRWHPVADGPGFRRPARRLAAAHRRPRGTARAADRAHS